MNLAELNFDTNKGAADPGQVHSDERGRPPDLPRHGRLRSRRPVLPASPLLLAEEPGGCGIASSASEAGSSATGTGTFLDEAERVKKAKGKDLEIIVTAMDSLLHAEIYEDCGIDIREIIGLMDRYRVHASSRRPLQELDATRRPAFLEYAEAYRSLVGDDSRLMFDVNCLANRDIRGHDPAFRRWRRVRSWPTTIFYASRPSGRVGIYAESTVNPVRPRSAGLRPGGRRHDHRVGSGL